MKLSFSKVMILLVVIVFIICSPRVEQPVHGFIELTYRLNPANGIEPSYQTVIWLENDKREYIKSLLVSEYLSYGGYNHKEICPDWITLADWEYVSQEEFDAVTMATPPIGENKLKIDCRKEKLLHGIYRVCIQTHIVEDHNILFCGELEIGGKSISIDAKKTYISNQFPGAENVLSDVTIKYFK